LQMRISR
jgi:hypothetical protein